MLFIGNSLTYYNHMPQMFQKMVQATEPGWQVDVQSVAPDAVMLEDHWNSHWTQSRLHERHWDYVILQEQGGLAHWNADGVVHNAWPTSFETYAGKFADVVKKQHGQLVMYEGTPPSGKRLDYMSWAYTKITIDNAAILAPVGTVVYSLPDETRSKMIIANDGHPTAAGSCVAAATLASAMFGKPPAALLKSCSDEAAAVALDAAPFIERRLAAIGQPGAYPPQIQPALEPEPRVPSGDPVDAAGVAGSWYARAPGIPLSWGVRLTFTGSGDSPTAHMTNYGGNAAFDMPVEGVRTDAGVLMIRTRGDNRRYRFELARTGDSLSGYAVSEVNGGANFEKVTFTRLGAPDDYFSHLDSLQAKTDATYRSAGLDAALLERYEALLAWRGKDEVNRITMGGLLSDPWLTMLTAQDYAAKGDNQRALEYFAFAARHFPEKSDPHGGLGEQLEQMGRLREALPELMKASEINHSQGASGSDSEYDWYIDSIRRRLGEVPPAAKQS